MVSICSEWNRPINAGFPSCHLADRGMVRRFEAGAFNGDFNGDGILDSGEEDLNGDGVPDVPPCAKPLPTMAFIAGRLWFQERLGCCAPRRLRVP